ncbi:MarR family winged helix-turn-helix transcriptional regulator [Streptomyces sp. KLOTTS4A1]|uniref:MarR family winged helix-turn-helix transcriptional regulator n=1 Tax=Streptomyces sp. KLOTTS4A1 TaxID=3390996 RepID=UPI0039F62764
MVDEKKVNQVDGQGKGIAPPGPGFELPLLLFAGFRTLIDALHTELAERGHPESRPAHGFALQAIDPEGTTASEIARRLGVSKQAAGKTVDRLIALGYAERTDDPADARRKVVRRTAHGIDLLRISAEIFDRLQSDWAHTLGPDRLRTLTEDLRTVVPPSAALRLDAAAWMGGA